MDREQERAARAILDETERAMADLQRLLGSVASITEVLTKRDRDQRQAEPNGDRSGGASGGG